MNNKVIPNRVDNFGSNALKEELSENDITPENYESHADKLPRPTGYRILILPFTLPIAVAEAILIAILSILAKISNL